MDQPLKQRLIGAAVLAALAVIFLPMLLKGPDVREPDAAEVPLSMPATPGQDFETRELPLTAPEPAPPGGVLGMQAASPRPGSDDSAVVPDDAVAAVAPPDGTQAAAVAAAALPAAVPPAVPVAPGSESAATGGGNYVVNLGTFGNRANAQSLVAKLRAAGLPVLAETVSLGAGNGTRVRVGPYADRAAAEAGRLRAQGSTNVAGNVLVLDAAPAATPSTKPPAQTVKPAPAAVTAAAVAVPPASSPQPSSPPSSAPPAASSGFAVQLSAPAAEADALALRDKARAAGLTAFVQRVDTPGGVRYRVRVGPYADRASAQAALGPVNAKLGTHGIVMRNP